MNNTSIPSYPNASIINVGKDHTMQYIRKTENRALQGYVSSLESAGFTKRFESSRCGNTYLTYASDSEYAHIYYVPDTRTVRIISGDLEKTSLPSFCPEDGVDQTFESTLTQAVLDYYYYDPQDPASRSDGNFGACYVVTLDDGSLLVYDGGGRWGKNDVERIWSIIKEKGVPDSDGRIRIAAWIITHEHVDHYWCMHHVLTEHGSELRLGAIYCTPISRELLEGRADTAGPYIDSPDALSRIRDAVGGFELIRMHTGQIFNVRNLTIEVLCTPEDIFPEHADRFYDFNDTTSVTRIWVNGKSFLNLGDSYHVCSRVLLGLWGNYLKSDYCTLAHHGWGGGTRMLYDHILPTLVFVPFSKRWLDRIFTEEVRVRSSGERELWIQWAIDRYGDFHKITQHVFFDLLDGDCNRFLLADRTNKTLDISSGRVSKEESNSFQIGYPYNDKVISELN